MASPHLETLCCVLDKNSSTLHLHLEVHLNFSRHDLPYNILSIISAIVGAVGAIFLLLPRASISIPAVRPENFTGATQTRIIFWLAFSDLLATVGIFLRSVFWLTYENHIPGCRGEQLVCAIISGWIQYFYTATYFWTLSYAIEVYRRLKQKTSFSLTVYHIFTWLISAILSLVGLNILYYPELKCYYDIPHLLPNYLCVLVPCLLVMIINPILYLKSTVRASESLVQSSGMYSNRERKVTSSLRERFAKIVLVFYICWLPNIFNAILMWTFWRALISYTELIFTFWYLMAVLNPLQAAFNAFVYRRKEAPVRFIDLKHSIPDWLPQLNRGKGDNGAQLDEQTPLLTNVRSGPRNVPDEMSVNGHFFTF